jgi:TatD DNase family protein
VIDTHAHLDACVEPASALLARARAVGIARVITVGSGIDSCRASLAIAETENGVACALGVHPHQAGGDDAGRIRELRTLLASPHAVAVGETGLDFYRDYAPRAAQRRLFEEHLALAAELDLPVVVHTRAADDATAELLGGFAGTVVLHCFSSPALLPVALERDYYVSFAGNVTFPKAAELRDAAGRVPPERILCETDCPYLAPQPVRGRPNEPANVVHTVVALAAARSETSEALAAQIDVNATRAFALP